VPKVIFMAPKEKSKPLVTFGGDGPAETEFSNESIAEIRELSYPGHRRV